MEDKTITIDSRDENQSHSLEALMGLLKQHAKYKERSYHTSKMEHVAFLSTNPPEQPRVVLFGDSMLERLKTTGKCLDLQPWPSEFLLSTEKLEHLRSSRPELGLKRLDGVFNAGVGGDKVENMLYRLLGDSTRDLPGLIPILGKRNVRFWIVKAGTNNLHPKHGLRDNHCDLLRLLLQVLLKISPSRAKILLAGLFYRTDIPDHLVDEANEKISALVGLMNANFGREVIVLLPPPKEFSKEKHLEDHVHLNVEGYVMWMEALFPKAAEMFEETKA